MPDKAANPQTYVELGQRLGNAAQELANMRDLLNKMFIFIVLGFICIAGVTIYQATNARIAKNAANAAEDIARKTQHDTLINRDRGDSTRLLICQIWDKEFPGAPHPKPCQELLGK